LTSSFSLTAALHQEFPENASPFCQILLPSNFSFEGKKSKAVSYRGDVSFSKGTPRTLEQAKACLYSWVWQWWDSLSLAEQSAIQNAGKGLGENTQSKKRKRL